MEMEKEKPLVSVIMGVFNGEKTLVKCIESIIAQTYDNWEFVICDDCSTDGTRRILEQYSRRDSRIKIISNEKNSYLAYSLNQCLKYATGEYIARMDADDESLRERLERQVNFMLAHPDYDVVGSNVIVFDEKGDIGIRTVVEYPTRDTLLTNTPYAHPTILMKKTVYDHLNGYTVSSATQRSEDLELWFRFYLNGYKGYNIQIPLYRYHETQDDYKKRTFKAAWGTMQNYISGYRMLGFSYWKYVYAIKPVVVSLIPKGIMKRYHDKQIKRNNFEDR